MKMPQFVFVGFMIFGFSVADLRSQGQVSPVLPLTELELVAKLDASQDIVAFGSTEGSDETIFATEKGLFLMLKDGIVQETPLLDITGKVFDPLTGSDKREMADFVVSPNFADDQAFYVSYTPVSDPKVLRISRFHLPSAEEEIVMDIAFSDGNYFGGDLEFGPDGFLYIATAAGGAETGKLTSFPLPQALDSFQGKILRIDVNRTNGDRPYAIPADNPFVGKEGAFPEVWAYGFNWPRIAFDQRLDGGAPGETLLYIIDQLGSRSGFVVDEINALPMATATGQNFGWPFFAGLNNYQPFIPSISFDVPDGTIKPIHDGRVAPTSDFREFSATSCFATEGVLHFASMRPSREPGIRHFFSLDPNLKNGYQIGDQSALCCRDSSGYIATGQGAGGIAYFAANDGSIYREIPWTSPIFEPGIDPTSGDGVIEVGWVYLTFSAFPYFVGVHFTTDGSEPTLESPRWDRGDPPLLMSNIVKAFAYHPSVGASSVTTKEFSLKTAPVEFDNVPLQRSVETVFRLSTLTPGAVIHYSLDETTPDASSPVYDPANPPVLSGPSARKIVAVAIHDVFGTSDLREFFHIPGPPRISILGDIDFIRPEHDVGLVVPQGARIYYTLDGSVPDETSPVYTEPVRGKNAASIRTLTIVEGFEPVLQDGLGIGVRVPAASRSEIIAGHGFTRDDGTGTPARLADLVEPSSMTAAPDGTVYIISKFRPFTTGQFLHTLTPDGRIITRKFDDFQQQFSDIAILPNGDLILPWRDFPGITILNPNDPEEAQVTFGELRSSEVRDGPLEQARFFGPLHVAVDGVGAIYLTDFGLLRKISPDRIVETIGGAGQTRVGDKPVALSETRFDDLRDIAMGPDGSLYIGDGSRLLRADRSGMVSLVAGSGEVGHGDGHGVTAILPILDEITVDRLGNCYTPAPPNLYSSSREHQGIQRISPVGDVVTLYPLTPPPRQFEFPNVPIGLLAVEPGTLLAASEGIYRVTIDDYDDDNIPDGAETGGAIPGEDDDLRDSDNDGFSNTAEYLFATSIDQPGSFPQTPKVVKISNEALAVLFPTEPGKQYRIEASDDFIDWQPVTNFTGGPFKATVQFVYPEPWRAERYFRAVE
ncbi:MAG: chitobiase/beta-hexosaminidase C-terminal domain-containing protein [Verrucomicrobiae bacterium]|nr:chitobiase/beta-hexosaminidase C-terminal domain-containing protein [Verrucomicrobiae bacterium]